MRCLNLAEALMARGAACGMLATPATAKVLGAFAGPGLERIDLEAAPPESLVAAARAAAEPWGADVLVVDHYRMDAWHERRLAEATRTLAVIDDLADREHACALLVDPGLGRTEEQYRPLTPAGARLLTGPGYALLAPAYAKARARALKTRRTEAPPRRLLVSLGLMDLLGITGRVLHLIQDHLADLEVDVVVGGASGSLPWLRHLATRTPGLRLHVDTREMAKLISAADIGVGAGGSSTWERAVLGLPSLLLVLADNQHDLAVELGRRGAVIAVQADGAKGFTESVPQAFERLLGDAALRRSLSETSATLCDGQGASRVADAVLGLAG
jgi:UDP-2,4-diacetamido-2,4,6-trideoxy-beta-L-altropyranose hydrolase